MSPFPFLVAPIVRFPFHEVVPGGKFFLGIASHPTLKTRESGSILGFERLQFAPKELHFEEGMGAHVPDYFLLGLLFADPGWNFDCYFSHLFHPLNIALALVRERAAVDVDGLAREGAGVVAGEEGADPGHLLGRAAPAKVNVG
jgi:hypothetical protein